MKILMICGTYPPNSCGIGDYLYSVVQELKKDEKYEISYIVNIDWRISNFLNIKKKINFINPDIIHIQYPSRGYGASFVPQIISLFYDTIVTIHEVSHSKILRKLSLFFFSFRSKIIFTNYYEYKTFTNIYPWFRNKFKIIPIGSNIKKNVTIIDHIKKKPEIIYFGQIRPKKGLEDVIKLSSLLKENNLKYKVVIMGQILPEAIDYYEELLQSEFYESDYVEWRINLSEEEIAENLLNASFAYLPFPDGVSERRGSFFAALAYDLPIFTTAGKQTTDEIKDAVNIVRNPIDLVNNIKANSYDFFYSKNDLSSIMKIKLKHSWKSIAEDHKNFYSN